MNDLYIIKKKINYEDSFAISNLTDIEDNELRCILELLMIDQPRRGTVSTLGILKSMVRYICFLVSIKKPLAAGRYVW